MAGFIVVLHHRSPKAASNMSLPCHQLQLSMPCATMPLAFWPGPFHAPTPLALISTLLGQLLCCALLASAAGARSSYPIAIQWLTMAQMAYMTCKTRPDQAVRTPPSHHIMLRVSAMGACPTHAAAAPPSSL
ncbi:hypothetical protein HaLaN_08734 [Haematococcus lacustris]|uniref:Uncharacterized protein n=1 Tax=Haematococcus lacustris TaxID=44745 RepID=A0A699Z1R7_HAELA|nr:hypothetical protein HaLaN_08734 [Haematococcus lacustris]